MLTAPSLPENSARRVFFPHRSKPVIIANVFYCCTSLHSQPFNISDGTVQRIWDDRGVLPEPDSKSAMRLLSAFGGNEISNNVERNRHSRLACACHFGELAS